jgi:AcrR family transcriptional regulator
MGLRQEKKAQARAAMADAAADLFGTHGYENVAMTQIAAAAGVSEQTLYNYFPSKESLVFDRADLLESTLLQAVAGRPDGVNPVEAFREWFDVFALGTSAERAIAGRGGMVRLVAGSDALRRALLDLHHRVAARLAAELTGYPAPHATVLADALLSVVVRTTERLGTAPDRAALAGIAADAHAALDVVQVLAAASGRSRT